MKLLLLPILMLLSFIPTALAVPPEPESPLEATAEKWLEMSKEDKVKLIENDIMLLEELDGIILNKPAEFYAEEIDKFLEVNVPEALCDNVGLIMKSIAILYDDWGDGRTQEEQIKELFGDDYNKYHKEIDELLPQE